MEYIAISPKEPFQPVRLIYSIRKQAVYNALKAHPQIEYQPQLKCFAWRLTVKEAQVEGLEVMGFPQKGKGDAAFMGFNGDKEMWVAVSSYSRVIQVQELITTKLGVRNIRLLAAELSTRMYEAIEANKAWVEEPDPLRGKEIVPDDYAQVLRELIAWREQESVDAPGITTFPEFVRWQMPKGPGGTESLSMVLSILRFWSAKFYTDGVPPSFREAAEELFQAYLERQNDQEKS